ncbi:DivIVA domain-containing protein [Lentzea albida]|uniref:DivIVA protein n=1 Tax=Lentzea albida TaxID=65499 RepID=A0A1H9MPT2_9PSEU|nr:hypothetical protein [Lentzea albida]SER25648.1 hypothetical protein SAMN04488000_107152 [Lentzea albida]
MAMDDLLDEGRTAFHTQLFGYNRSQVDEEYARLERQLELACADRDAALETADELTRHLEEARSELTEYRTLHAGHSKDNAVSGCIRYLLHVARRKADEIESEARARAEDAVHRAEEAAGRHARLLDEAEQESQRRLAEASQRAREIVGEALERSRSLLSDLGERQRLLDQWYAEIGAAPEMPSPRGPEPGEIGVLRGAEVWKSPESAVAAAPVALEAVPEDAPATAEAELIEMPRRPEPDVEPGSEAEPDEEPASTSQMPSVSA